MTWNGPMWQVQWRRDRLVYSRTPLLRTATQITSHAPDLAAWDSFWQALEEIGSWTWKKVYEDTRDWGGTNWVLSIRVPERVFYVTGANLFPPRFPDFLRALGALVGDPGLGGKLQNFHPVSLPAQETVDEKHQISGGHPR
jgi:hypothetical protein